MGGRLNCPEYDGRDSKLFRRSTGEGHGELGGEDEGEDANCEKGEGSRGGILEPNEKERDGDNAGGEQLFSVDLARPGRGKSKPARSSMLDKSSPCYDGGSMWHHGGQLNVCLTFCCGLT